MSIKFGYILLYLSVLFFSACNSGKYYFIEGSAQGTSYHITYKGENDFSDQIDSVLKAFDKSLSVWDSTSIISRINRNDPTVVVDTLFVQVIDKAKQVNKESDGAFDITVGPLVKAWLNYL